MGSDALLPWRRAYALEDHLLYWIPVDSFPIPAGQRAWLLRFVDLLAERLAADRGLRAEVFLQFKVLKEELKKSFLATAMDFKPVIGLSRRPAEQLPAPPDFEELKAIGAGKKEFKFEEYVADYCYWFVNKDQKRECQLFFGHGGMTIAFLPPDPNAKPPELPIPASIREHPVLGQFDLAKMLQEVFALQDGFKAKSKTLFGDGLQDDPAFQGLPFVLPLLATGHFFSRPTDEVNKWFELFDVYINESPVDHGVVMVFKDDFEDQIHDLLNTLGQEGIEYPG